MSLRKYLVGASSACLLASSAAFFLLDRASFGAGGSRSRTGPAPHTAATTTPLPRSSMTIKVTFMPRGGPRAPQPTVWDGSVTVRRGTLRSLRLLQRDQRDTVKGNAWKAQTHRMIPQNRAQRQRGYQAMPRRPVELALTVTGGTADTQLRFETAQGSFAVTFRELPSGKVNYFLKGLVRVRRIPTGITFLQSPTEDDFPSAVWTAQGGIAVAYVAFTHGRGFEKRLQLPTPPEDLSMLARPTGGDQVFVLVGGPENWTGPLAVTPPMQDVYRTAVAQDGTGRIWVVWCGKRNGNWDIFARSWSTGTFGPTLRLSNNAGPDAFPAAATDASGRVWVAYQSFRNGQADILCVRHTEGGFGSPVVVSDSPGNQWAPQVAAAPDGRVAFAWDSYTKGDYDVLVRFWQKGRFSSPIPIATSPKAEMRPSIAFDPKGRLWIAFEESPPRWGKDWGALEKEGVALYQRRSVSVRVLAGGKLFEPAAPAQLAFTAPQRRTPGKKRARRQNVKCALPRIAVGPDGRVFLAVRIPRRGNRSRVGTVWLEHIAWYEGESWKGNVVCDNTDNLLDKRPALLAPRPGELYLVSASDGRGELAGRLPFYLVRQLKKRGTRLYPAPPPRPYPDPANNELVLAYLACPAGSVPAPALKAIERPEEGSPSEDTIRERRALTRVAEARVSVGAKTLRLLRGEFHRHTEISSDGGGDGLLLDMWRYGLDAAALQWIGNGDHDNGGGREYSWWLIQKTTDLFTVAGTFTPVYSYERSCSYPDGHRNVVFAARGVRTLPRLRGGAGKPLLGLPPEEPRPPSPDTQLLYRYLEYFDGICASHTSATTMGTDWRDNNPKVEPVVEIYQGCRQNYEMPGAPRSVTAQRALGGWRPYGFVSLALKKGYRLGFQASSDHISTHISYCNVWAEDFSRKGIVEGMKRRHVYGSTDNIIAIVTSGEHFMGDVFTTSERPTLTVHLIGTRPFAKVHVIKDSAYVHTVEPKKQEVTFTWTDFAAKPGTQSYYYVRGEQEDGELVWVSPMWITYKP